jgi:hypothetical protein
MGKLSRPKPPFVQAWRTLSHRALDHSKSRMKSSVSEPCRSQLPTVRHAHESVKAKNSQKTACFLASWLIRSLYSTRRAELVSRQYQSAAWLEGATTGSATYYFTYWIQGHQRHSAWTQPRHMFSELVEPTYPLFADPTKWPNQEGIQPSRNMS